MTVLKILIVLELGALHFHFALDLADYATSPASALLPASGEQCLAEEEDSERQEVVSPGPAIPAGHGTTPPNTRRGARSWLVRGTKLLCSLRTHTPGRVIDCREKAFGAEGTARKGTGSKLGKGKRHPLGSPNRKCLNSQSNGCFLRAYRFFQWLDL